MIADREMAGEAKPARLETAPIGESVLSWLGLSAIEAAAWIGLLAATALIRLLFLGSPPLNLDEGRRALEAYTLLTEGRVAYEGSPVLTNLTSLVFVLFTDGEAQARLIPALAGIALVGTPYLLRPAIPGLWALLAGVALAASTTLLTASRSVSPAVPAMFCVALTACGAWRFGQEARPGWLVLTFAAALTGLGLDTSFVIGLIGLMLGYAISEGEIFGRTPWWPLVRQHGPRALAIAALIAVLLDTRFASSPPGLQAGLIDPLWRWSGEVARGAGLTAPLLVGLMDGAILFLAVVGLLDYQERPRVIRFLGTWLLVALTLASLMRMPDLRYLAPPLLPACLLAGFGIRRLAFWIASGGTITTLMIGLAGLVPVITSAFQINAGLRQGVSPWGAASVVLIGGLILVGLLGFNLLRGMQLNAAFATWASVILVLGVVAGNSRALDARGSPHGQLVEQSATTPDIEFIRQSALKWYRADPNGIIPVDATLRPVLGWTLRDVPTVRYDAAAREQPRARLLADPPALTGPGLDTLRAIVGYTTDWSSLSLQPSRLWQWMAHRESLVTLRPYAIVLIQPAGR